MKFYSIKRISEASGKVEIDTSSLAEDNGALRVVGVLPHGCRIEPKDKDEALELVHWLVRWVEEWERVHKDG